MLGLNNCRILLVKILWVQVIKFKRNNNRIRKIKKQKKDNNIKNLPMQVTHTLMTKKINKKLLQNKNKIQIRNNKKVVGIKNK